MKENNEAKSKEIREAVATRNKSASTHKLIKD